MRGSERRFPQGEGVGVSRIMGEETAKMGRKKDQRMRDQGLRDQGLRLDVLQIG